jgi:cation:H+ antiporter
MLHFLLLTFSLIALIISAEVLVRGGAGLARTLGVPPLVAGLTVVAFVTSAPQMTIAVRTILAGSADLVPGMVVGSNIFAVLFTLALAASVAPLVVTHRFVRFEVPAVVAASLLLLVLALDGSLGPVDGIALVIGLVVFTPMLVLHALQDTEEEEEPAAPNPDQPDRRGRVWTKYGKAHRILYDLCLIAFGLLLLILGTGWLVDAAAAIAPRFGMSDTVASLTLVAACACLPGVATSIQATLRGEPELAVGAVLGSCAFNILAVAGLAALLAPTPIAVPPALLGFDMLIMTAVAAACLPLLFTGNRIEPWQGAIFFAFYVGYVFYLVMATANHAIDGWRLAMLAFVLPLTVLTFAVIVWRKLWDIAEAEA